MKKFSTAAALIAFASVFLPLTSHAASSAEASVNPDATRCLFLDKAPDQHTVEKGDTLWGISGKFLEHPWCWPQVWGLNREQISDPHWIYPGQIVYFDRVAGRLRLGTPTASSSDGQPPEKGPVSSSDIHMSPQVRTLNLSGKAISSI